MKLIKKLLKKTRTYRKLTLAEKVACQQQKVELTFCVFANAYEDVQQAQEGLKGVIAEANVEINKLQKVLDAAVQEHDMNEKVKTKLAEFVPGA